MTYCHHCGHNLTLGCEIYCPKCGTLLQSSTVSDIDKEIDNNSSGSISKRDETRIGNVGGNVRGVGVSGTGNMFGGTVEYHVSGDMIIVGPEYVGKLNSIRSKSLQLETQSPHDRQINRAQATKKEIGQLLKEIDEIDKKNGTNIDRIRAGEVQISRIELILKDVIAEGNEYFYKFEYSKAIECYDKALEIDGRHVKAWINKGHALDGLGPWDEAIECYDKALEIDSKDADAWSRKALVLTMKGRRTEALEYFEKALEIDSNDADAWNNRGATLYDLGRRTEGLECFEKALEIDEKNESAWYNKGSVLDELGKYDEALEHYDKALEIDSEYEIAWYNRGLALEKLGKHEDAKKCFDMAKLLA